MKSFSRGGPTRRTACGQDHVAQRLPLGQPDRARRVALAAVHRDDPRPVDLGDVGAVGECQRSAAQHDRVRGHGGQLERGDAEPDQVDEQQGRESPGRRPRRRRPAAAPGTAPGPRWSGSAPRPVPWHQHHGLDATNIRTSNQKASSTSGNESLKTSPVEEGVADLGPARAGQDQRRQAADDDDGRGRGDRQPAAVAPTPRRRALGAAVAVRLRLVQLGRRRLALGPSAPVTRAPARWPCR